MKTNIVFNISMLKITNLFLGKTLTPYFLAQLIYLNKI